jgi:Tfp pilus assembly protein PilP
LDEVWADNQHRHTELESLKIRAGDLGNKMESNKAKIASVEDKLVNSKVELTQKIENNEGRIVRLEEATITQNERLDEVDK